MISLSSPLTTVNGLVTSVVLIWLHKTRFRKSYIVKDKI